MGAQRNATQTIPLNEKVVESISRKGKLVRDEVVETINMPGDNAAFTATQSFKKLDSKVITQLREYITKIAIFYHADNGFHNFQHASHVIMSTIKLFQRVATPDVKKKDCVTEKEYFNFTF